MVKEFFNTAAPGTGVTMDVMQNQPANEHHVFLSTEIANSRDVRFARAAGILATLIFFVAAPFASRPLTPIPAFIATYESALAICDLITAVLLFGQFTILRSKAMLVLAGSYLFTAMMTFMHLLSFPNLFSPTGLLGAGPQTTAWLYMFWHGGFPLFILVYALLETEGRKGIGADKTSRLPLHGVNRAVLAGVTAILAVVCGLTLLTTVNHNLLPVLVLNNRFVPLMKVIVAGLGALSLLALVVLAQRRQPYRVLDLWLMVVLGSWFLEVVLSSILSAARFDVGWYAGRIFGFLSASSLLIVFLIQNVAQYARLVQLSEKLSAANKSLEQLSLHDALTELANRRFFDTYFADQITIANRHKRILAFVLYDIDCFKAYNDHYGHQAGDECLKQVAAALQSCCHRSADMVARYGGEEFAMILPDTELIGAVQVAEAAREAVARLRIPHAHSTGSAYVSISGGIVVSFQAIGMTVQQLITAADQNLYQAKKLGRNRMVSMQTELVLTTGATASLAGER
jgi:diguanylate cyclase (GGDEF)-like protein